MTREVVEPKLLLLPHLRAATVVEGGISRPIYGTKSISKLINQVIVRVFCRHESHVMVFAGGPGSGKTTILSELLACIRYRGLLHGLDEQALTARVHYFAYEVAQRRAGKLGYSRTDAENSWQTRKHYQVSNAIFAHSIYHASVRRGQFIIVEAPGMVGRGDTVLEQLGKGVGEFAHLKGQVSFMLLTSSTALGRKAKRVRTHFQYRPDLKVEILERRGTDVLLPEGDLDISGGGITAVQRYYTSEAAYLCRLVREGVSSRYYSAGRCRSTQFFANTEQRSEYLERVFAPWYFGVHLQIPKGQVFVGRNTHRRSSQLYQNLLQQHQVLSEQLRVPHTI